MRPFLLASQFVMPITEIDGKRIGGGTSWTSGTQNA